MTRIRANCPDCGDVDLQPADIELCIVPSGAGEVGAGSNYRFSCPDCRETVTKPADERIARLLATGGVEISFGQPQTTTLTMPVEDGADDGHPESAAPGPALTYDDLLDLHLRLQQPGWFAELADIA